jgi:hypothetical protein
LEELKERDNTEELTEVMRKKRNKKRVSMNKMKRIKDNLMNI